MGQEVVNLILVIAENMIQNLCAVRFIRILDLKLHRPRICVAVKRGKKCPSAVL